MNENQELIDEVVEEMKLHIADNDWSVIEGLLTLIPTEKLIEFLPADEEDEELQHYILAKERFAALVHWEKRFRDGTVDDEHGDFIANTLAAAREPKPWSPPPKAKQYLRNYLEDLEYWRGDASSVAEVNFYTSGTPSFYHFDDVEEYIKPLKDLLEGED